MYCFFVRRYKNRTYFKDSKNPLRNIPKIIVQCCMLNNIFVIKKLHLQINATKVRNYANKIFSIVNDWSFDIEPQFVWASDQ
jgi:hypothetical protein